MPPPVAVGEPVDLDALAPADLDRLDAGVIGLDAAGVVLLFSAGASTLCGLSPDAVLGRNYFREVVPSANVPSFFGRFLAGTRRSDFDETFEFVFGRLPQPMRARVRMLRGRERYWLTIQPMESLGAGQSREAVIAAVGRRARAEPVD
ncbi:PAS domain-containing protein, partial [Methylobacterium trifolii]